MHCKDVSVRQVGFPLTPESIGAHLRDWKAYVRAQYLVMENDGQYAVVELRKEDAKGTLFREVTGYRILALPDETVFVERPGMDVLNLPAMAALQLEFPGKAVIVRGLFSHVSFVKGLKPLRLAVVDSVPPEPSKLGYLVKVALASGYVELPVVVEERIVDMVKESERATTPALMFPCEASNIRTGKPTYFLDHVPHPKEPYTLIGCHLSWRIHSELYANSDVPFINVCPRDFVPEGARAIAKCCKVKSGHEIRGTTASVPWGVTVPEVVDAINDLFSDYRPEDDLAEMPMVPTAPERRSSGAASGGRGPRAARSSARSGR